VVDTSVITLFWCDHELARSFEKQKNPKAAFLRLNAGKGNPGGRSPSRTKRCPIHGCDREDSWCVT
jgi:hypothetical protein